MNRIHTIALNPINKQVSLLMQYCGAARNAHIYLAALRQAFHALSLLAPGRLVVPST